MLFAVAMFASASYAQTANVQIIHNSPDPAADTVDVYVNGALEFNDFVFRTATPFLPLSAGVALSVAIAPGNSSSVADAVATFNGVQFNANDTYVVVASGVLNPASFTGVPTAGAFNLEIITPAQQTAAAGTVDLNIMHGAPDAPAVDVFPNNSPISLATTALVNNLAYPNRTGYVSLPAAQYALGIAASIDSTNILATFGADVSALGGNAAVVLASGFLNPANATANNGFGLYVALPSGGNLVALPALGSAKLQVIHNSPDPAAASVDVYLNGVNAIPAFGFRTATPFLNVFSNFDYDIAITPAGSPLSSAVATFNNVTFQANKNYIAAASGVLNPASFTGVPTAGAFMLKVIDYAVLSATAGTVATAVMHGAPDAPAADIFADNTAPTNAAALLNNVPFGAFSPYLNLPAADYVLGIAASADSNNVLVHYNAPLSGFGGAAVAVFASGFLNPANATANNGFGLWVAPAAGGAMVPLSSYSYAKAQLIHNCPDALVSQVDVYLNDELVADNFAFRTSSPFLKVLGGFPYEIAIAPANSTSSAQALVKIPNQTFTANQNFVVSASGVVNPALYTGVPSTAAFGLRVIPAAQLTAPTANEVSFAVSHGSPDAPTVDVFVNYTPPALVNNLSFGASTGYVTVPAAAYTISLATSADSTNNLLAYDANLMPLAGGAGVVVASGFLNAQNATLSGGNAFGLYVSLPSGGALIPLQSKPVSVDPTAGAVSLLSLFPNPAQDNLSFAFSTDEQREIQVLSATGALLQTYTTGETVAKIDISQLPAGMFLVRISTQNGAYTTKFSKL